MFALEQQNSILEQTTNCYIWPPYFWFSL